MSNNENDSWQPIIIGNKILPHRRKFIQKITPEIDLVEYEIKGIDAPKGPLPTIANPSKDEAILDLIMVLSAYFLQHQERQTDALESIAKSLKGISADGIPSFKKY